VVVGLRSRYSAYWRYCLALILGVLITGAVVAAESSASFANPSSDGYLARIQQNSPKDVKLALLRAEELYLGGEISDQQPPLAFVLHGPEVAIFFKNNYADFKSIVDLAARLSAFGVIDVAVCRTRLGVMGQDPAKLFPFVSTVPFGPDEVERLLTEEQYVYF